MKLIFIHWAGENYKGTNQYDFLFTEDPLDAVEGEDWDSQPASGNPRAPLDYVASAHRIETDLDFELIQDHEQFDMYDCKDGVIGLAWEDNREAEIIGKRLFFKFGESFEEVTLKLYSKDIHLEQKNNHEKESNTQNNT